MKEFKLDFFLNKISIVLKDYNKKTDKSYCKKQLFYFRNLIKKLKYIDRKLKNWYIFSYSRKSEMLKSKKYMLALQKNIINRYNKIYN